MPLSFKTPEAWLQTPGIRQRYEGLVFQRDVKGRDAATRIVGVGHQVFDQALKQARDHTARLAAVPGLDAPIAVFTVRDRVTDRGGQVREIVIGVSGQDNKLGFLKDWQLLDVLNPLIKSSLKELREVTTDRSSLSAWLTQARACVEQHL